MTIDELQKGFEKDIAYGLDRCELPSFFHGYLVCMKRMCTVKSLPLHVSLLHSALNEVTLDCSTDFSVLLRGLVKSVLSLDLDDCTKEKLLKYDY